MDAQAVIASALGFNQSLFVDKALDGLTDEDLRQRPNDYTNPIGWTLWHQYRVEDAVMSNIGATNQAWIDGRWHEQFGMEANPGQVGGGDSLEQVMALQATLANLQGYAAAVREKTLATLNSLTPEDLEREIPGPGGQPRKVGDMLGILLVDHFHHSGQVCYLRGYLSKGWSPF